MTFLEQPADWGDGIRRSADGWADYPEMDAIMEGIYQATNRASALSKARITVFRP
jgi:hypothetical protein